MKQYHELIQHVLKHGQPRDDRTQTGVIGTFGYQSRYDLTQGFPLITTKKIHFKSVLVELLWFISGNTNIQPLVKKNVRIWNDWPYAKFQKSEAYQGESMDEFIQKVKEDDDFALKYGDLGPVYGHQWRDFFGVDQLLKVIEDLKHNPYSRRHIISAWNPAQLDDMALPPCHAFMQFYVHNNQLSLQLYQRSADVFLGVPFNIASYALLLMMVAKVCGYEAKEFVHTLGDVHIYNNHLDQVHLQLSRDFKPLPAVRIKHKDNILDFVEEDFELIGYEPHPHIAGKVSV
jgi:thymidylate synthase